MIFINRDSKNAGLNVDEGNQFIFADIIGKKRTIKILIGLKAPFSFLRAVRTGQGLGRDSAHRNKYVEQEK